MPKAIIPHNEAERLKSLREYEILDTPSDQAFDDLARIASVICETPIAMVSLVDADRQWFKSAIGMDIKETSRGDAFCGYTILSNDLFVVPDTQADARFAGNPMVVGPEAVRFYAGTPLLAPDGHALGALCVKDRIPRKLTDEQMDALRVLARQVMALIQLRKTARELAASERLLRSIVDTLIIGLAVLDSSGKILLTNHAWTAMVPTPDGAVGANYLSACETDMGGTCMWGANLADGRAVAAGLRRVMGRETERFEYEYPHFDSKTGGQRWSFVRIKRLLQSGNSHMVVRHEDMTERHAAAERLLHNSRHDALTGLPNRILFEERVDQCIKLSRRGRCDFAVLFVDLDRFKIINDSLGHAAGDSLLTTIAERLRTCVRTADTVACPASSPQSSRDGEHEGSTVARMGGDEFTILLENLTSPKDAARVAERIRAAVAQPVEFDGHELITTASIGIVACSCGSDNGVIQYETARELLRDADAAMYKAKAAGKDQYVIFDQAMHAEVMSRMRLEADLRRAIDRNELELHYQPIVNPTTQAIAGFEALVRWRRSGVLMSPAEFIPVAEDTGLIIPIGQWVLSEACRQIAKWRALLPSMDQLYVTVNVSRRQFIDADFVSIVERALAEFALPASALGLEITESAIMQDPATAERMLDRLKYHVGVRLSIDDFGTGYSSLSCLQRFPIDLLKVDRVFVQNLSRAPRDAALLRTIVNLAHDLNMSVVAEGIETREQATFLSEADCDFSQGFLYSRPLDAPAAEQFMQEAAKRAKPSAAA